jgi:hypothetical protein
VTHRNAPVTPEGRLRSVTRCRQRPTVHIVAEDGISRQQHLIHCIIELRAQPLAGAHDRPERNGSGVAIRAEVTGAGAGGRLLRRSPGRDLPARKHGLPYPGPRGARLATSH